MNYLRRGIAPSWNIHDADAPSAPQGVTTSANISRCRDITIMQIIESTSGMCGFSVGQVCVAESTYKADVFNTKNGVTYAWEIVSGVASFKTDAHNHPINNVPEVIVVSVGSTDTQIEIKCTVTDGNGNQTSKTDTFTHTRKQL